MVSESSFEAELSVGKELPAVGRLVAEFEEEAENADVLLTGIIRNGKRFRRGARRYTIAPDDFLVVKGSSDAIAAFIKATNLQEAAPEKEDEAADSKPARKREDMKEDEESGEEEKERAPRAGHRRSGGALQTPIWSAAPPPGSG